MAPPGASAALRRFAWLLLLTALLLLAAAAASSRWQLLLNVSDSMSQTIYLLHRGDVTPRRGQLVALLAPSNRLYPDGAMFLKYIAGVPGDCVSIRGDGAGRRHWMVAGMRLGALRETTSGGLPLRPGPVGCIPPGQVAVWTPHEDGYDSRYQDIGWVDVASLVGLAQPLW